MANDVTGSVLGATIEGIPYRVAADANITHTLTKYENSMIATSGKSMSKKIKRVPAMESIVLICNGPEKDELKSFADSIEDVKFSVTLASGDAYKSQGAIEIENVETEDSRVTVQFLPREDWTPFFA